MTRSSTESTPRERLARLVVLMKRSRRYLRTAAILGAALAAISLLFALNTKRIYKSETTVVYRDAVRAGRDGESPAQRAARLGPRLKELVLARTRLATIIDELGLYPELAARSTLEAVDEMQKNVSFRVRSADTFALSFTHHDPATAQKVTARLAEVMIEDYSKDNVDAAVLTHDVLQRELDEANKLVEDTSRGLARFLAKHPQFTWGLGDSPYAATPAQPGALGGVGAQNQAPALRGRPGPQGQSQLDPVLARLVQRLSQIDAELAGPNAKAAPSAPVNLGDAEKQRDTAAAALAAAAADLANKLQKVTPAHPDAIAAKSKVDAARSALAAAESHLGVLRTGNLAPPPPDANIDPTRRAELDEERRSIAAQIAARRAALGGRTAGAFRGGAAESKAAGSEGDPEVVELETEWHKLRLDLERARDHFRKAQDKERVASLSATAAEREGEEELVIVDPAYLPEKPDRGRGRVFFAGSFVALFLALGYAGARVLLCDTVFDEGDVETLGGPPLLVSLPHIAEPARNTALVPMPPPLEEEPREKPPQSRRPIVDVTFEATTPRAPEVPPPSERPIMSLGAPPLRSRTATLRFGLPVLGSIAAATQAGEDMGPHSMDVEFEPDDEDVVDREAALSVRQPAATLDTPEVEVVGLPFDPIAEGALELVRGAPPQVLGALRVLRHKLEQQRGHGSLVVSVHSPGDGEGKTSVAARLAMTLAEAQRARVVLVEGNLARPRLASMLGLRVPEDMGFSSQIRRHMSGRWDSWKVLRIGASLYVLAEPAPEAAFPAALQSTWFPMAMRALKENYDYVVVDGCPVLGSGDANVIEGVSDVVVLCARAGSTQGSALVRAAKQLGDRRMLGVVLNDVPQGAGAREGRAGA
jgi:Mrp family chromosome partitioning ATPase